MYLHLNFLFYLQFIYTLTKKSQAHSRVNFARGF